MKKHEITQLKSQLSTHIMGMQNELTTLENSYNLDQTMEQLNEQENEKEQVKDKVA